MKKFKLLVLTLALLCTQLLPVYASIGDIATYTTYTDILAYINHYLIQSYNVNGYTVIVAEDLVNYGFNVVWNDADRTLSITRNIYQNEIIQEYIPYETDPKKLGKNAFAVLETDIKVYVNGVEARSYNIGGKTVIDIESLTAFGSVCWDPDLRVVKLWVEDSLKIRYAMQSPNLLPRVTLYSSDGRTIDVYQSEVDDYLNVGWFGTKSEANEAANLVKNKAAVKNFYVGQEVFQWALFYTKYGVVREVNQKTGKVKVYWNKATDGYGQPMDYFSASIFGAYTETWEEASSIKPLY